MSDHEIKLELLAMSDRSIHELNELFAQLADKCVMMVPAGVGLNGQIIAKFACVCDVFVYRDYAISHEDFLQYVRQMELPTVKFAKGYFYERLNTGIENWAIREDQPQGNPWADIVQLEYRLSAKRKRKVWLINLSGCRLSRTFFSPMRCPRIHLPDQARR